MKTKYLSILAAGMMAFTACTDNNYTELNLGNTELEITTNATDVVLNEAEHSQTAVELTWTSGTNYGTGNKIYYTLELAEEGTEFANPTIIKNNVLQDYAWAPTVEKLNSMLINDMGVNPGSAIALEARITAVVEGLEGAQVSTTAFTATTYEAVTETLYIIGSAAPNGWSADNATEMDRIDNGIFSCIVKLSPGEFKFITTRGQFLPSYNKADNGGLVYRDSDDQPDEKFIVENEHYYKVDVNLFNLTITMKETEGVQPPITDKLYFVGSETGWGFWPMTIDPLDPYLFRISVFFNEGGEFKFGTSEGSWENMFKAPYENAPYTAQDMQFIKGFDPDPKWVLTADETNKAYKICCDIRVNAPRMMMSLFIPYTEMYMIGSATSAGWDLGNAVPMNVDASDPNIFTWTGNLNEGELKFSCDKNTSWMGAWFMADTENKAPTGTVEKVIFIDKSSQDCADQYKEIAVGDIDRKWYISDPGNYTITLNQFLEEITIVKN